VTRKWQARGTVGGMGNESKEQGVVGDVERVMGILDPREGRSVYVIAEALDLNLEGFNRLRSTLDAMVAVGVASVEASGSGRQEYWRVISGDGAASILDLIILARLRERSAANGISWVCADGAVAWCHGLGVEPIQVVAALVRLTEADIIKFDGHDVTWRVGN